MKQSSQQRLNQRHRRVRAKLFGTHARPRLAVSRSVMHIQAQIIDDEKGATLVGISDQTLSTAKGKTTKSDRARAIGEAIAKQAREKGITKVVFDRGGFRFHGRIAALAEGARKGGLEF